jgi:predicted DsbA family dithiol-disulfide isomerase
MTERLLKAYFTESKHIGDHETLAELAAETGLDKKEVERMLAGDDFTKEVRSDEQAAGKLGARGVFFRDQCKCDFRRSVERGVPSSTAKSLGRN